MERNFPILSSDTNCGRLNKHQLENFNLEPIHLDIKCCPHPAHPSHTILHNRMTSQTECFCQPNAHKANYPNGFSEFHSIPNFGTTSLGSAKNVLLIETSYSTSYTHLTQKNHKMNPKSVKTLL